MKTTIDAPTKVSDPITVPGTVDTLYLDRMESTLDQVDRDLTVANALAVSIVMPVYNERETVAETIRRVQAVGIHQEIVIVDDFSLDGTREVLVELAKQPDIRLLMHGYNRGKGAALRTAFAEVQGDVILIQDADLEYNPGDYPRLLAPLQRGEADVVYGSRFLENAEQDPSRLHRFGNRLLTALSNRMTGHRLTDMETCYKVFRREILDGLEIEQDRFGFEPEFTAQLARQGHQIVEVPIAYHSRGYGEGKKIGFRDALNSLWCIAKYK